MSDWKPVGEVIAEAEKGERALDYPCMAEGCDRVFGSRQALSLHNTRVHRGLGHSGNPRRETPAKPRPAPATIPAPNGSAPVVLVVGPAGRSFSPAELTHLGAVVEIGGVRFGVEPREGSGLWLVPQEGPA